MTNAALPYLLNLESLEMNVEHQPALSRGVNLLRGSLVNEQVTAALRKLADSTRPTDYVNDPFNIARNDRMVEINSALQVDLTGQVNADSIGTQFYSGVGGQVDFIRGAARSKS